MHTGRNVAIGSLAGLGAGLQDPRSRGEWNTFFSDINRFASAEWTDPLWLPGPAESAFFSIFRLGLDSVTFSSHLTHFSVLSLSSSRTFSTHLLLS